MPQRVPTKQAAPAELINQFTLGYNGYTDPTLTNPKMWVAATNVLSGAFGYIQRARFATVYNQSPVTGLPYTTFKYFALPGTGAYLIADQNGKLYSYDTSVGYTQTQRLNPYFDPTGAGSTLLNGPFMRESLGNILYEVNGQVKQAGRLANAATIEGFGLDAPDASPQVTVGTTPASQAITGINRSNGVVTVTVGSTTGYTSGQIYNITGVSDTSFNGSFTLTVVNGTTFTYSQFGQTSNPGAGGSVTSLITKAVGRSYAYAWENANKFHVGAPSPATQFIAYNAQNGTITLQEPGTVAGTATGNTITGTGTFFTSAWVGRNIFVNNFGFISGSGTASARIISVQSPTSMTVQGPIFSTFTGQAFQILDPQITHVRLYATADGGATYFRIQRNALNLGGTQLLTLGLILSDNANAEPPNFPFTTETAQANNIPPPIGSFLNEYQGRLIVYGVPGAGQSFFYSNQESTSVGLAQESFAPLNQVTLPIANANMNGMIEFPGSAIIWSDKQDMFRVTGLLTDNTVTGIAQATAAGQQGAQISRLPYNLGCATPFSHDITPLGAIWLTSNAEVWLYTDRYAPRNIGRPVQDILSTILPNNLKLARGKYFHAKTRNWFLLGVPANGSSFNNTLLVLDLDQLASNGSPSYFTFDMATNQPTWFVFSIRCDSLETVYENAGLVRFLTGQVDQIQDADYQGGSGTEIAVPNATVTLHAWGNDSPMLIKRPTWIRFNTNQDPSQLAFEGWSFAVNGIDDDFYTFFNPLTLTLTPGVNDSSTLGGNPDFSGGLAFRHSPELYRIGGVNFVMGRRLQFQVNFPSTPGANYQLRGIQIGFGVNPPN